MPPSSKMIGPALLAVMWAGVSRCQPIEIIRASTVNATFPAVRDGAAAQVESRSLQITTDTNRNNRWELLIFRDSKTGLFLWMVRELRHEFFGRRADAGDLAPNIAIRIDNSTMRGFFFVGYSLLISEARSRAASLDAAQQQALSEYAAPNLQYWPTNWWTPDAHWIRLVERLPNRANPPSQPTRLLQLPRTGRCWRLQIEEPGSASTPITFDESYDLIAEEDCGKPKRPVSHVVLPPSTAITVSAVRNKRPTKLDFRYSLAQVTFPDGQKGRILVLMVYDPHTRLFWWNAYFHDYGDRNARSLRDIEDIARAYSIFVTDDRIAVFEASTVRESKDRFPSLRAAEAKVALALEPLRGKLQAGRFTLNFRQIDIGAPADFFRDCNSSFNPGPFLQQVERIGQRWRLRIVGSNGNSALVELNENFGRTNTQLTGVSTCPPGIRVP